MSTLEVESVAPPPPPVVEWRVLRQAGLERYFEAAVRAGAGDPEVTHALRALGLEVERAFVFMRRTAEAVADANAEAVLIAERQAELAAALAEQDRARNEDLERLRALVARHEAEARALADANVDAVLGSSQLLADLEDYERECRALTERWESERSRSEKLARESVALAEANARTVEELMLREDELGEIVSRVNELNSRNEALVTQASRDHLTGLCSRRAFDERIERLVEEARRTGERISVLFVDVDHFKQYNDRNGHSAGDRALRRVGEVITSVVGRNCCAAQGRSATAARYGGEEFVVLLPGLGVIGAQDVAEQLRLAVGDAPFAYASGQPAGRVTVSIGAASLQWGESASALLARADAALYRAKACGRDRVAAAFPSGEPEAM